MTTAAAAAIKNTIIELSQDIARAARRGDSAEIASLQSEIASLEQQLKDAE